MTGNWIDCISMYGDVIGDLKIYMFLRQSIWSTNKNIEGNSSFRISKCKSCLSSLAPLAHIFIDFLNVSVLSVILSFIMPYHWIGCMYVHADVFWDLKMYIFLRRSLASLARAYKLHIHDFFFFCRYIWGSCPPPPPIVKSWLRYCGRVPLPLVSNTLYLTTETVPPNPCIEIIYCTFGGFLELELMLIQT